MKLVLLLVGLGSQVPAFHISGRGVEMNHRLGFSTSGR